MRQTAAAILACGLVMAAGAACTGDRPKLRGTGCELNSECEAPLVCRLGRCRVECRHPVRDCARGLECWFDENGLGGCSLPDEATCALDSDCRDACATGSACELLVCKDGRCGRECVDDRDCPDESECKRCPQDDASCEEETATGVPTCRAPSLCVWNHDCPEGLICDEDQVCRVECVVDRDCDYPRLCNEAEGLCVLPDGGF